MKEVFENLGKTIKSVPKVIDIEKKTNAIKKQFEDLPNLTERVKLKDTIVKDFEVDKDTFIQILMLIKDSHFKDMDRFEEYYNKEIKDAFK